MSNPSKRSNGLALGSILRPTTTRPEIARGPDEEPVAPEADPIEPVDATVDVDEGQGGDAGEPTARSRSRAPKVVRKDAPKKLEPRKVYLSDGVFYRLRQHAIHRDRKISEMVEDILDRALPFYEVSKSEKRSPSS